MGYKKNQNAIHNKQKQILPFIIFYVCFFYIQKINAQNANIGSWNILNIRYSFNETLAFFGEGQLRSLKFYDQFHYYEYKGGVDYKIYKNVRIALGVGNYQTYKEGGNFSLPKNSDETRIWPQFILLQSISKLTIEQRYRAEFRFANNTYKNRFRYRLGVAYPFGKKINDYQPFQINVNNEIFFTNQKPYFERNRFLVSINYKPSKPITLQMGYLHQLDYKPNNDEIGRNFLVMGFYYEIFRKNGSHNHSNEIKNED